MTLRATAAASLFTVLASCSVAQAAPPHLVVLTPTGQTRDGLPVLARHPDASAVGAVLTRGYSGRLLRLYALEQEFLRRRTGQAPEPAYLLLSNRQGGFPQFGFYLGSEKKADAGWVDLHRNSQASGRFGAMDQIFPHELLHIIVRQLAGEPRESGGNQVHAIGVRTDPVNAFSEGFAEHAQILAVDDPDAVSDTLALRANTELVERAAREAAGFSRDLARWWLPVRPSQIRFLLWFSQSEQVWRYHAVKANLFARSAPVPPSLLSRHDKYDAYLYQNVVPGTPDGRPKSPAAMLSTEGVVAHLSWRLVTDPALQQRYASESIFTQFGVTAADVSPLDNVYVKLFVALADGRPSTCAELLRAYVRLFPEDAEDVARVVREALLQRDLPPASPEVWLANDALTTGTSLFDQFRGAPRTHTFDVNAASELDWLSVPGVTPTLAARLLAGAPYPSVQAVQAVPGLPADVSRRVAAMSAAMAALQQRATEEEETLSLGTIARPYLVRIAAVLLLAAGAGAWLARRAGAKRWWTAGSVALAAATLTISLAWVVVSPPSYPVFGPVVLFGLPWSLWRLARQRSFLAAASALLIWAAAALPAIVLSGVWLAR